MGRINMSLIINKENTAFTVKELKDCIKNIDDNLFVNIYVIKKNKDGIEEGFIFPLESVGTNSEEFSITCFDASS